MELLSFNGYQGSVETAIADNVLHGKILFVGDLVTYEAQTLGQLKQEFEAAVIDYVATCKIVGKKPEKSLSGQFNIRVGPELHQRALVRATTDDVSLNAVITAALGAYLIDSASVHNHVHKHEHVVALRILEQKPAWVTPSSAMQYIDIQGQTYGNKATH